VVLREEFATRTEAADLSHPLGRGRPASAEEFVRLITFKGMTLVVRAYFAVLPANLPVLFCIFDNSFSGIKHEEKGVRR